MVTTMTEDLIALCERWSRPSMQKSYQDAAREIKYILENHGVVIKNNKE